MSGGDEFRDRAQMLQWNFVLSMFSDDMGQEEKIKVACNAGVSNPDTMGALLNTPVTDEIKEKMVSNLFFQGNPIPSHLKDEAMKLLPTNKRK